MSEVYSLTFLSHCLLHQTPVTSCPALQWIKIFINTGIFFLITFWPPFLLPRAHSICLLIFKRTQILMTADELVTMSELRLECRRLMSIVQSLKAKRDRQREHLIATRKLGQSHNDRLQRLLAESRSDAPSDVKTLTATVESLEQKLEQSTQEFQNLEESIERITQALEVQKKATAKRKLYGQVNGVGLIPSNAARENFAGALQRSLEEECDEMRQKGATTRQLLSKQAQIARAGALA